VVSNLSLLPLTLGIGFSLDAEEARNRPSSKAETDKILKKDDYSCRFCGFRSLQYQRVIPFEGGHVTSCSFCEQAMMLERAGMMGSGVLIWLPEISQIELNHIVRAIHIARVGTDTKLAAAAERAFNALLARKTDAKKRLGSEDPLLLCTVLRENLDNKDREKALPKLDGLRLLPFDKHIVRSHGSEIDGFPQIVRFWLSEQGPFSDAPVEDWRDLFSKLAA